MADKAFVLRLDHRESKSLSDKTIGVGWAQAKGLDSCNDWDRFKGIILQAYPGSYKNSPRALGNVAGSLYTFMHSITAGDFVVIPVSSGFFVCKVKNDQVIYDEECIEDDYAWKRSVEFLTKKPLPRNIANNDLQKRMKARQTCVSATDLLDEIKNVVKRENRITFKESVLSEVKEKVAKALLQSINDRGLEELVRRLALASGAEAVILHRDQKSVGDIDILATYDLKIAQEDATIKVAYQVKQHKGITDKEAVNQLINILDDHKQSYDKGCVVTTAECFSEEAEKLANENNIIMIAKTQLIEWVLNVGLEKLDI